MGENKKYKGFFYITRNSLVIYSEELPAPLVFPFDKNIVSDYEIVNKEEFVKQLTAFLQQNKVSAAIMSTILGEDVFFEKDIPLLDKEKKDEMIKLFIDTVPFEHVTINTFPTKTGNKLIVTNKDFFDIVDEIATRLGFTVQFVIPAYYFDKKITTIDTITGKYILDKIPSLKQFTLSGTVEEKQTTPVQVEISKKQEKSKLPILIGIFLLLLFVLGGVILFASKQTP